MPVQIEVNDSHIKHLTDFYIQRLKVLREEIIERERESKEINATIQKLRKGTSPTEISSETKKAAPEYSEKWPWIKKVHFAIEQQQRPLTTKEIVDTLTEYETSFIYDRKRAVASISSILSSKWGNNKEFIRMESESGDFAYGLNDKQASVTNNIDTTSNS